MSGLTASRTLKKCYCNLDTLRYVLLTINRLGLRAEMKQHILSEYEEPKSQGKNFSKTLPGLNKTQAHIPCYFIIRASYNHVNGVSRSSFKDFKSTERGDSPKSLRPTRGETFCSVIRPTADAAKRAAVKDSAFTRHHRILL